MLIINTYTILEDNKRLERQAELHRKCILILQTSSNER